MLGRIGILLAVCCLPCVRASAQNAPDMFKDVPREYWAYGAVESLCSRGILIGYPEGYFRGKRTLTRYEFAVAIDRALEQILGDSVRVGTARAASDTTQDSKNSRIRGLVKEDVLPFRRLVEEFRIELGALGNNVQAIVRQVEQLAREVGDTRSELNRMPRLSGGSFGGFRLGSASASPQARDFRFSLFGSNRPDAGALRLGLSSPFAEVSPVTGGQFNAGRADDPRMDYAESFHRAPDIDLSSLASRLIGTAAVDAEVGTPFTAVGQGLDLTMGQFRHRLRGVTLLKADGFRDADSYYGIGPFRAELDGLAFETVRGPANSIQDANWAEIPRPSAAASRAAGGPLFTYGMQRPGLPLQSSIPPNQLSSVSLGLAVRQLGDAQVRLSAAEVAAAGGPGFSGVHALGADVSLRLSDRLSLFGDWGKTITHTGRADTADPQLNNAFNASVQYDAGSLNLSAGYRFVDPNYYAPELWGRIGNWFNPTNIAGPSVRAAWDITPRFAIKVGGEMLSAARDRTAGGGLGENDSITRALVGIRWNLSSSLETTLDWEGIYWEREAASRFAVGALPGLITSARSHPTEHYFTLGTGYSLTSNTKLRLMYQIGTYDGKGLLLNPSGFGARSTFNIFSGQVAVKF